MTRTAFRDYVRYSIRFRVLCSALGSVLSGLALGWMTEQTLRITDLVSLREGARVNLALALALCYTVFILALLIPMIVKPLSNLDQQLRRLKSRSEARRLDPSQFGDLSQLVETTQDFVEWAQNQQSLSAMIHNASRKRIEHLVEFDTLTGLYNRHYLQAVLPLQLSYMANLKDHLSLIMLDVDHFKHYNDTNGHPAGDRVLARIAEILRNNVREQDICCRYGGEEFLVVLPNAYAQRALGIAQRIREAIEKTPFPHEERQPSGQITASLGLATFPQHANAPEQLIECADQAMYRSKRRGRNRISTFDEVIADTGATAVRDIESADSTG